MSAVVAPFKFQPFSDKQKLILSWWMPESPFHDCSGIIADGAVRSGKTLSMSLSFVIWAMTDFNNCNFAMCGKTQHSIRRNSINDLKRMLPMCGYTVEDKRSEGKLIIHGSGHTNDFYLFGGRDERSQDIIQGITLAGCLLDEVALMPESFAQQATLRCSVDGARQWYNCNPAGSPTHWFKSKWIDQYKRNNFLYLHFTMEDNLSLSPEVRARYERQYVGMYYRRYIEGRWVSAEGVIYDMWDNNENIYTEDTVEENYQYRYPRFIGVDYGTTNPMVFLDCIDTGEKLLIKNEYYYDCKRTVERKQKTNTEYADDFEEFVQHDHGVTVIIDPSAESFALELRNRGYRVKKADNEVLDGIRKTAAMIKARRIQVLKDKTPNFLREVETYVWDENATLRGEEKPLKVNDHALDSCRYLVNELITRRRMTLV